MRFKVIDINTGWPIEGAYIYLNGYSSFTDSNGEAVINAPDGTYNIRVTHKNYDPLSFTTSLVTTSFLTIRLTPLLRLL